MRPYAVCGTRAPSLLRFPWCVFPGTYSFVRMHSGPFSRVLSSCPFFFHDLSFGRFHSRPFIHGLPFVAFHSWPSIRALPFVRCHPYASIRAAWFVVSRSRYLVRGIALVISRLGDFRFRSCDSSRALSCSRLGNEGRDALARLRQAPSGQAPWRIGPFIKPVFQVSSFGRQI